MAQVPKEFSIVGKRTPRIDAYERVTCRLLTLSAIPRPTCFPPFLHVKYSLKPLSRKTGLLWQLNAPNRPAQRTKPT